MPVFSSWRHASEHHVGLLQLLKRVGIKHQRSSLTSEGGRHVHGETIDGTERLQAKRRD